MAHGRTPDEALANCKEAMDLWLDTAREFGRAVPKPKGRRLQYVYTDQARLRRTDSKPPQPWLKALPWREGTPISTDPEARKRETLLELPA